MNNYVWNVRGEIIKKYGVIWLNIGTRSYLINTDILYYNINIGYLNIESVLNLYLQRVSSVNNIHTHKIYYEG